MARQDLESRLAEITREFVTRLVHEIRNASFAEVAALPEAGAAATPTARPPVRPVTKAKATGAQPRARRSAAGRAEVGERVVQALSRAGRPIGVRELADAVGLTPEALAAPLRELRTAGKIDKHGDKRATKYSAA
jgi:DNA-binding transcriptional ArsR family regulator